MPVTITVTTNSTEIVQRWAARKAKIMQDIAVRLNPVLRECANYIANTLMAGGGLGGYLLHKRSGLASSSVHAEPVTTSGDQIVAAIAGGAGVPYFKSLEYGAQPHVIVPVNAKALRFAMEDAGMGGYMVFAKKVNHPGNPAFAPIHTGITDFTPLIAETIRAAVIEGLNV